MHGRQAAGLQNKPDAFGSTIESFDRTNGEDTCRSMEDLCCHSIFHGNFAYGIIILWFMILTTYVRAEKLPEITRTFPAIVVL